MKTKSRLVNFSDHKTYAVFVSYWTIFADVSVFQAREGSQVKNPRNLAAWPGKINRKLEKVWGDPHLLIPQNSLLAPCL